VRLDPLDWPRHGEGLFNAIGGEANAHIWTWMPVGPFAAPRQLQDFFAGRAADASEEEGWRTMVILSQASGAILGSCSYMRIRAAHGSCEIGCVAFGDRLRRTPEATEALRLMAAHVFDDLGYRRYEWKCNVRNAASMRAAARFGFVFEGIFRNDMVTKGQSRDTAWFSITAGEWVGVDAALRQWLAAGNFGADGSQIRTLESFRTPA
jgi:RimJ/RimL family protein N-acetyltransferase